jgi:FkbM family methyltransferase
MTRLQEILSTIQNGFFFEAGANDGVEESNTHFLELNGWQGILVEPNPSKYYQCSLNRKAQSIHGALVSNTYNEPTVKGNFLRTDRNSLMCSIFDIPDYFTEHQKQEIYGKINEGAVEVPALTLEYIFDTNNVKHVDFLSLDLEGYEVAALSGLNFNKIKPKYILIETANNPDYQQYTLEFLSNKGYSYFEKISGNDDLFILE